MAPTEYGWGTHVVVNFDEQVGFFAAAEIKNLVVAAARVPALAEVLPIVKAAAGVLKNIRKPVTENIHDSKVRCVDRSGWQVAALGDDGLIALLLALELRVFERDWR